MSSSEKFKLTLPWCLARPLRHQMKTGKLRYSDINLALNGTLLGKILNAPKHRHRAASNIFQYDDWALKSVGRLTDALEQWGLLADCRFYNKLLERAGPSNDPKATARLVARDVVQLSERFDTGDPITEELFGVTKSKADLLPEPEDKSVQKFGRIDPPVLFDALKLRMAGAEPGFGFESTLVAYRCFLWCQVITGGDCHVIGEYAVKFQPTTKDLVGHFLHFLECDGCLIDGSFASELKRRSLVQIPNSLLTGAARRRELAAWMADDLVELARDWRSGRLDLAELLGGAPQEMIA